ncbi:hypothetical protein GGR88_001214 [Sphingomonas jejuensis]|uniref:Uncharacterized protein n=1 Tax=Sphingomonas jejuensis TaxID=904715 RepID=A0ABX0XM04_9SPHN|nr:hypothetical protein [Sphingomonas jejuensis]NJC33740.1 hypothetical protein [Sphingomonas jejuensis]
MTERRSDGEHKPEPSHGPDEEGEVPLPEHAHDDDRAAWVHKRGSDKRPVDDR